jgi:hypothetical protein
MAEGDGKRGLEAMTTYFSEDVTPEVVRGFFKVPPPSTTGDPGNGSPATAISFR